MIHPRHPLKFICNIHALPHVLIDDVKELPECPGLYFLFAGHGRLLYIGRSINLRDRWKNHDKRTQASRIPGARVFYHCCTEAELDHELPLIEHHNPEWNAIGPTGSNQPRNTYYAPDWVLANLRDQLILFIRDLRTGGIHDQELSDLLHIVYIASLFPHFRTALHEKLIGYEGEVPNGFIKEMQELYETQNLVNMEAIAHIDMVLDRENARQ